MSDPPLSIYHPYRVHLYEIRIMPDGVEVERIAPGNVPVAKSISIRTMLRLHTDSIWNIPAIETLIDRYEHQLTIELDKPMP
jgi:hypothetical protein